MRGFHTEGHSCLKSSEARWGTADAALDVRMCSYLNKDHTAARIRQKQEPTFPMEQPPASVLLALKIFLILIPFPLLKSTSGNLAILLFSPEETGNNLYFNNAFPREQ